jgi:DNA-binding transcriptional LysR family regulator
MMQIGQLEGFLGVARRRTLSRAASELYITQPALTARIQRLEEELGVPLFLRTPTGMRLTDPGRAFLPYATRALDTLAAGRQVVAELAAGGAGHLSVGAAPAVSTYVLPPVLKRFAASHPNVRLTVRTGHSEEILGLVLNDEVEIGLVRALRHPGIQAEPLYEERLVLVVDERHRFAGGGRIEVEELSDEQLILFDRTSSYHDLTAAFLRESGVVPRAVMELDNIEATKKMVQEGLGVAFLPQSAVATEVEEGLLCAVEIVDAAPERRRIVLIRRRDAGEPTGLVMAFMDTIGEAARARGAA